MSRALLVLFLMGGLAWGEEFKRLAEFVGGMSTLWVGVEFRSEGARRGQLRFATSGAVTELRFNAAQWQAVSKAVKSAMEASRELQEGENGDSLEVAGLRIRPVRQRPQPGVQLAAGEPQSDATIVVHDYARLKGALDDVAAALRQDR